MMGKLDQRQLHRLKADRRRGAAYVEFALVFILLITLMVGAFEFTWVLFVRATFHHATREAVRSAITGNPSIPGESDNSIKAVIQTNTFGLLKGPALDEHVSVRYFDPTCTGTPDDCELTSDFVEPSSIVKVSIMCYEVYPISSLIRARDSNGNLVPFNINVSSSDLVEPFPGVGPSRGTKANPTACS